MHDPEEIFSGISAVLTVAPPPPEPEAAALARQSAASASRSPVEETDDTALMQATSSSHRSPSPTPGDTQNAMLGFNHRMTPAALVEFRQTLEWQSRGLGHRCSLSAPASFQVRSWYLNSHSRTRTEDSQNAVIGRQTPHLASGNH